MSFNNYRKNIAGLLTLLSVAGATLGTSNLTRVMAIDTTNYYGDGDETTAGKGSPLEKAVLLDKQANTEFFVLKNPKVDRAKWQKNIEAGKFATGNPNAVPEGLKQDELVAIKTGSGAEDDRTADKLTNTLKTLENKIKATANANLGIVYENVLGTRTESLKKTMQYSLKDDENTKSVNLDVNIDQKNPEFKSDVVYFHTGNRVYATTSEILMLAQELTGEIIVDNYNLGDAQQTKYLSEQCPLAAALLVNMKDALRVAGQKHDAIHPVSWLKYDNDADKLTGKFVLKAANNGGLRVGTRVLDARAATEKIGVTNTNDKYYCKKGDVIQCVSSPAQTGAYNVSLKLFRTIEDDGSRGILERANYFMGNHSNAFAGIIAALFATGAMEGINRLSGRIGNTEDNIGNGHIIDDDTYDIEG